MVINQYEIWKPMKTMDLMNFSDFLMLVDDFPEWFKGVLMVVQLDLTGNMMGKPAINKPNRS